MNASKPSAFLQESASVDYEVKTTVLRTRNYKAGYQVRTEEVEMPNCPKATIRSAYTPDGLYLGDPRTARFLCVKSGLSQFEKTDPGHTVATIGFDAKRKRWAGWSHRAVCSFGIGDKLFEEHFGNDETPFVKHGRKTIRTLKEAKLAASRFAEYVS